VKRSLLLMGIGALAMATAADAHHSFAKDYQEEKQVTLEGDIVSFDLRNPHSWVYFNATDGTGVARQYGAEWANRRRLEQQGIAQTSLKAGDHVIVTGAPSRSATTYSVHLRSIRRTTDGWSWPSRGRR